VKKSLKSRFWSKVRKGGYGKKCWIWKGAVWADGYGATWDGKNSISAHRLAYILSGKAIPKDKYVRQKCGNKLCCRPSHLTLNSRAGAMKGIKRPRKLSEEQIADVIASFSAGELQHSIAERYGVSQSFVSRVVRRKRYVV
jgi:hypothetical protein